MSKANAATDSSVHEDVFDKYFQEVYFSTHAFGDRRQIEGVKATYEGQELDEEAVTAATARLIPKALTAPVEAARGRIRNAFKVYCIPGDGRGRYYVSTARADDFVARFNIERAAFDAAADAVAAAYDDIVAMARDFWLPKMGGDAAQFERVIGRHLPRSAQSLRGHYSVEFRPTQGTAKASRYKTGAVKEWFDEAHRNAVKHQEQLRRERYAAPIRRLGEALSEFQDQLNLGQKVSPGSFTAVDEAITLLRVCADIMAPELVAATDRLADEFAEVRELAQAQRDSGGAYTHAVKARRADLNDLIDRVVADCEAATSAAALAVRFDMPSRVLTTGRARTTPTGTTTKRA